VPLATTVFPAGTRKTLDTVEVQVHPLEDHALRST